MWKPLFNLIFFPLKSFLTECQKKLGHKLPLAAYLLKPVQRITKYQLLLKDLLKFSDTGTCTKELQKALDCMLVVLKCVNDSMHQIAITAFPVSIFGALWDGNRQVYLSVIQIYPSILIKWKLFHLNSLLNCHYNLF